MWKNFFYFSGSQRAGILVLLGLIVLISLIDSFLPLFYEPEPEQVDSSFLVEVNDFKNSLHSIDSCRNAQRFHTYQSYYEASKSYDAYYKKKSVLFPFNPNVLDSAGFAALGIKPYVISNILKYRRKVSFKDKTGFARIYGMSASKFEELAPFIQLPESEKNLNDSSALNRENNADSNVMLTVELNAADTSELMQIKGIGKAYAYAIVRFRKQTGGFISVEQLNEIYGMTPDNFVKIKPFCTVNPSLIQKIRINTASVEKLKAHPYLNFYQARQIYELRRKKGRLTDVNDLKGLSELNELTIGKISAYLNFE